MTQLKKPKEPIEMALDFVKILTDHEHKNKNHKEKKHGSQSTLPQAGFFFNVIVLYDCTNLFSTSLLSENQCNPGSSQIPLAILHTFCHTTLRILAQRI